MCYFLLVLSLHSFILANKSNQKIGLRSIPDRTIENSLVDPFMFLIQLVWNFNNWNNKYHDDLT